MALRLTFALDVQTNKILDTRCIGLSENTRTFNFSTPGLMRFETDRNTLVYKNNNGWQDMLSLNLSNFESLIDIQHITSTDEISISMSDINNQNIIVVGVPIENMVYIYIQNDLDLKYVLTCRITNVYDTLNNFGNKVLISSNGNQIVIKASGDNLIYVINTAYLLTYVRASNGANLIEITNIQHSTITINPDSSVSLSTDSNDDVYVAIGTSNENKVSIYNMNDSLWVQLVPDINVITEDDKFGSSVSLSIDSKDDVYVAIGASNGNYVSIYKYNMNDNSWTRLGPDINGTTEDDKFGTSVSLSIDSKDDVYVAIGASNGNYVSIYKYNMNDNLWTRLGQDINSTTVDDKFGSSVILSIDSSDNIYLVISALNGNYTKLYSYINSNFIEFSHNNGKYVAFGINKTNNDKLHYALGGLLNENNNESMIYIYNNNINLFRSVLSKDNASINDISDISNINITSDSLSSGQILRYNSSSGKWENTNNDISDISNINISSDLLSGQILRYNSSNEKWENTNNDKIIADYGAFKNNLNIGQLTWNKLGQNISTQQLNEIFGNSVSLSSDGNIVAISVRFINSVHVRVYQYDERNYNWYQIGVDIELVTLPNSSASISLSSDGRILAIGVHVHYSLHSSYSSYGHVKVFKYDESDYNWNQLGEDINSNIYDFSISLSSDGNTVAIGYPNINNNTGHVKIYELIDNLWTPSGQIIAGTIPNNNFGLSVSLSSNGKRVAIIAQYNDSNGVNSGHVGVYELIENSWTQLGQNSDNAGSSVSLNSDGTIVAIVGINNTGNGVNSGHVRVYQYDELNKNWYQIGEDIDSENTYNYLEASVSLSSDGTALAIGFHVNSMNSDYNNNNGNVRVFNFINNSWVQLSLNINTEYNLFKQSGLSLSSDGTRIAINLFSDVIEGHVRVFELNNKNTLNVNGTTNLNGLKVGVLYDTSPDWKGIINNQLSHNDDFALLQKDDGTTVLNSGRGRFLVLKTGNQTKMDIDNTRVKIYDRLNIQDKVKIGDLSDSACFSFYSFFDQNNFALKQASNGNTILNAHQDGTVYIRTGGNYTSMEINNTQVKIYDRLNIQSKVKIGDESGSACFSYNSSFNPLNYALKQASNGNTILNTHQDGNVTIRAGGIFSSMEINRNIISCFKPLNMNSNIYNNNNHILLNSNKLLLFGEDNNLYKNYINATHRPHQGTTTHMVADWCTEIKANRNQIESFPSIYQSI